MLDGEQKRPVDVKLERVRRYRGDFHHDYGRGGGGFGPLLVDGDMGLVKHVREGRETRRGAGGGRCCRSRLPGVAGGYPRRALIEFNERIAQGIGDADGLEG
jgi:hypothetical protein